MLIVFLLFWCQLDSLWHQNRWRFLGVNSLHSAWKWARNWFPECEFYLIVSLSNEICNLSSGVPKGGAKGPWPPPNRKLRGPNYHTAPPPFEVNNIFLYTSKALLFIVYFITREGDTHLTIFSYNACFFLK